MHLTVLEQVTEVVRVSTEIQFLFQTVEVSPQQQKAGHVIHVHSFMPCESESWLVKEEDVIRLQRGIVERWLDSWAVLGQSIMFLQKNLGLD